jgi:hypothetical protein
MTRRATSRNLWFGKIGILSRLFWTSMLAIHVPLGLRCFFGLFHEGGLSENLVSFIALAVSSVFFVLKLAGLRLIPQRPDWRKTVAFCVLGALLHVLVFSPTLMENHYNLSLILSVSGGLALVSSVLAFLQVVRRGVAFASEGRFWAALLRSKEWVFLHCLPPEAVLKPALIGCVSRRGPPRFSPPYGSGN